MEGRRGGGKRRTGPVWRQGQSSATMLKTRWKEDRRHAVEHWPFFAGIVPRNQVRTSSQPQTSRQCILAEAASLSRAQATSVPAHWIHSADSQKLPPDLPITKTCITWTRARLASCLEHGFCRIDTFFIQRSVIRSCSQPYACTLAAAGTRGVQHALRSTKSRDDRSSPICMHSTPFSSPSLPPLQVSATARQHPRPRLAF